MIQIVTLVLVKVVAQGVIDIDTEFGLWQRFASAIDNMWCASTIDTMLSHSSTTSKQQLRQNENAGRSSVYRKQVMGGKDMAAKQGVVPKQGRPGVLYTLPRCCVNNKSLPHSETAYNLSKPSSQASSQAAYGSSQQAQMRQILYQKGMVMKQKEAYAAQYQGAMPIQPQQGYYQLQ